MFDILRSETPSDPRPSTATAAIDGRSSKFHVGFWRQRVDDPHYPSREIESRLDARKHQVYTDRHATLRDKWSSRDPVVPTGEGLPERRQLAHHFDSTTTLTKARERKTRVQQSGCRFHGAYPAPSAEESAATAHGESAWELNPVSCAPHQTTAFPERADARRARISECGVLPRTREGPRERTRAEKDARSHYMREALAESSYGGFERAMGPLASGAHGRPSTAPSPLRVRGRGLLGEEELTPWAIYADAKRQLAENTRYQHGSTIRWDATGPTVLCQAVPDPVLSSLPSLKGATTKGGVTASSALLLGLGHSASRPSTRTPKLSTYALEVDAVAALPDL
jgi:hypothetical protein